MNYSRQTYKRGGGDPSLFLGIFYVENAKLKVAKKNVFTVSSGFIGNQCRSIKPVCTEIPLPKFLPIMGGTWPSLYWGRLDGVETLIKRYCIGNTNFKSKILLKTDIFAPVFSA